MNKNKLKATMMEHGDTGKMLAKHLGITEVTFSAKLNNKNGYDFNHKEITMIVDKYKLDPERIAAIFFEKQVSKLDTLIGKEMNNNVYRRTK